FTYAAAPAPSVSGFDPGTDTDTSAGGAVAIVNGSDFTGATSVMFGDTPASSFSVDSTGTQITAVVPSHAAGVVDVIVTPYSGTSTTSVNDQFTYTAAPLPSVASVTPSSGSTGGGTEVTITGSNFTGATAVSFGTVACSFTVIADNTIDAIAPSQAAGT